METPTPSRLEEVGTASGFDHATNAFFRDDALDRATVRVARRTAYESSGSVGHAEGLALQRSPSRLVDGHGGSGLEQPVETLYHPAGSCMSRITPKRSYAASQRSLG